MLVRTHFDAYAHVQGEALQWDAKISIAFRIKDGETWSPWSRPRGFYHVDPTLNDGDMHVLTMQSFGDKNEL